MGRQLCEIARRREELVIRAHNQRLALSENRIWTSGPFLIAEHLLDLGRGTGVRNSVLQYTAIILAASFPNKTLRLASRGLMIWMTINRIRNKFISNPRI